MSSSPLLAKEGARRQKLLFNTFGISCNHNCIEQKKEIKDCYKSAVVYGTALSFATDFLREKLENPNIRGKREFCTAIFDETDNLLIDHARAVAKLASPINGMEHFVPLFICAICCIEKSPYFQELIQSGAIHDKAVLDEATKKLHDELYKALLQEQFVVIPNFLKHFVVTRTKTWARSALMAFMLKENVDYVVSLNDKNEHVIAPVDYADTGTTHVNTHWPEGLHQCLQIRHRIRFTAESLTTSFISFMTFFKKYKNVAGLSGTLGSRAEALLFQKIYDVEVAIVPTFKKKIFKNLGIFIADRQEDHYKKIIERAMEEGCKGRSVLIIAQTINEALLIADNLKYNKYPFTVKRYIRSDKAGQDVNRFDGQGCSGDIIVATNMAGRGTDIITSEDSEKNGGLHVLLTFLPKNQRVEEQAFGRTSRQGKKGTAEIILNGAVIAQKYSLNSITPDCLRTLRDKQEVKRLDAIEKHFIKLAFEDKLFKRFVNEIYSPLKLKDRSTAKLNQLKDLWGFWLSENKKAKMSQDMLQLHMLKQFDKFKEHMLRIYSDNRAFFVNPSYFALYATNKLGEKRYEDIVALLADPNHVDKNYSYPMHYLRAYALFQKIYLNIYFNKGQRGKGPVWVNEHLEEAYQHLYQVAHQVTTVVGQRLFIANNLLDDINSPLATQLTNKLFLINDLKQNVEANMKYIGKEYKAGKNVIKIKDVQPIFRKYASTLPKSDIVNMANSGIPMLFGVETKKYEKERFNAIVITLVQCVKTVAGVICAMGGNVAAFHFAIDGLMGIKNGIEAIDRGQYVEIKDFIKQESINTAIYFSAKYVTNVIAPTEELSKGVTIPFKEVAKEITLGVTTHLAIQEVVNLAIKNLTPSINSHVEDMIASIENTFNEDSVKQALWDIYLVDNVLATSKDIDLFQKNIFTEIAEHQNLFRDISLAFMESVAFNIASQQSAKVLFLTQVASTIKDVGMAIHKLNAIKEDMQTAIRSSATSVQQGLPTAIDMLIDISPILEYKDAQKIDHELRKHAIIWDRIGMDSNSDVDKIVTDIVDNGLKKHSLVICSFLNKVKEATKDYNAEIKSLATATANGIRNALRGVISSGIMRPIISLPVDTMIGKVVQKMRSFQHA